MTTTLARIQLRRGIGSLWTSANPLLLPGEVGLNLDNGKIKVGNGSALYEDLEYIVPANVGWFGAKGDGSTNDLATLQDAIDSELVLDFGDEGRNYLIDGALQLRTGQVILGHRFSITQSAIRTEIFNIEAVSHTQFRNIIFNGLGTDFNNSDSSRAVGIYGAGSGSNHLVQDCEFNNLSYTAVKFEAQSNIRVLNNTIIGPGTAEITPVTDGANYGYLFDAGCNNCKASGNTVSEVSNGARIEACTNVKVLGDHFFNIVGQHGIYAGQDLVGFIAAENTIEDTALCGIKVQQADAAAADSRNINVENNTIRRAGSHSILVSSGDYPTTTRKTRNVVVCGNTCYDGVEDGINLNSIIGLVCTNNGIDTMDKHGISYAEISNYQIENNNITNTQLSGLFPVTLTPNGSTSRNRLTDVAQAATPGDRFGIFVQDCTNMDIDDNVVADANAHMEFGVYLSGGTQTTTRLRRNTVKNATGTAFRSDAAATSMKEYRGNSWTGTGGPVTNEPVAPIVASVNGAMTIPQEWNVIHISGTNTVTSILAAGHSGRTVKFIADAAFQFTDGSNLKLSANWNPAAVGSLVLSCDGTNWNEDSRSVN